MPILQGGKSPDGLPRFRAGVGSDDYMLIVASWVDAHAEGVRGGARSGRRWTHGRRRPAAEAGVRPAAPAAYPSMPASTMPRHARCTMPKAISGSVGRGGRFPPSDVMTVQYLLNCVPASQGGPSPNWRSMVPSGPRPSARSRNTSAPSAGPAMAASIRVAPPCGRCRFATLSHAVDHPKGLAWRKAVRRKGGAVAHGAASPGWRLRPTRHEGRCGRSLGNKSGAAVSASRA